MKATDATIPTDFRQTDKAQMRLAASPDTFPPHSVEGEQGVLGCILLAPADCLNECGERGVCSQWFYDLRHRSLWECFVQLEADGIPIDVITLTQRLRDVKRLESVGGISYVCSLPDATPSAVNLNYYIDILKDADKRRRLVCLAQQLVEDAYDPSKATAVTVERAEAILNDDQIVSTQSHNASELASLLEADLDGRVQRQGAYTGIVTGFHLLDYITDGLQAGEQCIVASRPSVGKTALGVSIAARVCVQDSIPTLFVSLEMGERALMRRLAASYLGIHLRSLRKGNLNHDDMKALGHFFKFLRTRPLFMVDGVSGLGSMELSASIRRHVRRHGIKLVIVDYLQKITPAHRHEKRTYEVAQVSGQLKAVAEKTKVALLTLAQLNRESDRDKPRRPKLTDLADSGQIERDADVVALLHRDRSQPEGLAELIVAKNRDGELGTVDLKFNGPYCRFENVAVPEKKAEGHPPTSPASLPHPDD